MDGYYVNEADMDISEEPTTISSSEEEQPKGPKGPREDEEDIEAYNMSVKRKSNGGKNYVSNQRLHLIYGKKSIQTLKQEAEDKTSSKRLRKLAKRKYRKAIKEGFVDTDTFKTHLPKELYIEWIKKMCKDKRLKLNFIALAHETSDKKTKYCHTHVLMEFSKPFTSERSDIWDYTFSYPDREEERYQDIDLHPQQFYVNSKKHFERCKHYLAKQDPENAHLKRKDAPHWLDVLEGCQNETEALRKCAKTPNQVGGILTAYHTVKKMQPIASPYQYSEFFTWQTQVKQRIDQGVEYQSNYKVDMSLPAKERVNLYNRKWIVIYNPEFGAGKTQLALSLASLDPVNVWASQELSRTRDLASQLKAYLKKGTAKTMIVNITADGGRDLLKPERQKEFRTCCEKLTDGWIMSEKYEGGTERWKPANLFIFTNYMPKLGGCDPTRWEIYHVADVESPLRLMTLDSARECYKIEKETKRTATVDDSMYDKRFPGLWHPPRKTQTVAVYDDTGKFLHTTQKFA